MNTRLVITSLAPPGVVIQLDGPGAERLAMTPEVHCPITQRLGVGPRSRNDKQRVFICRSGVAP
jgi:hypothetical protein